MISIIRQSCEKSYCSAISRTRGKVRSSESDWRVKLQDRQSFSSPSRLHDWELCTGAAEHIEIMFCDRTGADHQVDVLGRRQQSILGALPAGYGLRTDDRAAAIHHKLEVRLKLALGDSLRRAAAQPVELLAFTDHTLIAERAEHTVTERIGAALPRAIERGLAAVVRVFLQ